MTMFDRSFSSMSALIALHAKFRGGRLAFAAGSDQRTWQEPAIL